MNPKPKSKPKPNPNPNPNPNPPVCDAISCGDDHETARARYLLRGLLVSGQCYQDVHTSRPSPPNGLQLVLSPAAGQTSLDVQRTGSDTLVMKNLGYYQLQASPGLWRLSIAEGRGKALYGINPGSSDATGVGTTSASAFVESRLVSVRDFTSDMTQVYVSKLPGMESIPLLEVRKDIVSFTMAMILVVLTASALSYPDTPTRLPGSQQF